jgi:hypothetical protein
MEMTEWNPGTVDAPNVFKAWLLQARTRLGGLTRNQVPGESGMFPPFKVIGLFHHRSGGQ